MMQGGENNVDVALGRQLQGIQRDRSARKKRSEALQTAFEQRIQKSERKEAQFYDLDVRVEESQITNPFGRDSRGDENFVFYGAEFDSDTSKGYDPTWVAVTNGVFDEMMLSKKDAKARNSINGKNVRGVGPGGPLYQHPDVPDEPGPGNYDYEMPFGNLLKPTYNVAIAEQCRELVF